MRWLEHHLLLVIFLGPEAIFAVITLAAMIVWLLVAAATRNAHWMDS